MTVEAAHRLLVVAVVALAVEDILGGRLEVGWLDGAVCRHWCEWVDLEPGAVRRDVEGRLRDGRRRRSDFSREQMEWAMGAHNGGASWAQVAGALGTSHHTLRAAMQRAGYETGYRTDRVDKRRGVGSGQ